MQNEMLHKARYMTPQELADDLQVPVRTIHQWRYLGKGPQGIRVGRHLRFRRSDVEAWLRSVEEDQTT